MKIDDECDEEFEDEDEFDEEVEEVEEVDEEDDEEFEDTCGGLPQNVPRKRTRYEPSRGMPRPERLHRTTTSAPPRTTT